MAIEPLTNEMKLAWDKFKSTKLFGVLASHMDAKFVIENEGLFWCLFYNGYLAGWSSDKERQHPAEQASRNKVDLCVDVEGGERKADGGDNQKQGGEGDVHKDSCLLPRIIGVCG